ncbi:hypothetical protein AC579_1753 [Pseudocercospora musae]|uniref:Uncharacterized protein n=1 Tax=Pseudocercospora musae TaxID=113226 RepID=A0A139IPG7_9PEZI|nr:hypothetical protein AC579_1753 [Pseudocercospora musae]
MYASYVPTGTHPALVSINGAEAPAPQALVGGELDVDFDIAHALLGAAPITLYQIQLPTNLPDSYTGDTLFGSLLDALDGSFCDQEDTSAGFQCGGAPLSSVTSISYGGPEFGNGLNVVSRVCNKFMKLSLPIMEPQSAMSMHACLETFRPSMDRSSILNIPLDALTCSLWARLSSRLTRLFVTPNQSCIGRTLETSRLLDAPTQRLSSALQVASQI